MGYTITDLERRSKEKSAVRLPPPETATKAATTKDQITATPDDPGLLILDTSYVGGKRINLIAFARGIPSGSLTDASDVGDATLILKQMQYALDAAGLPLIKQIPLTPKDVDEGHLKTYIDGINAVVQEISVKCNAISDSVKEEVNKKQKEQNKPASDPKQRGKGEMYSYEWTFWKAPRLVLGQVTKARDILVRSTPSFIKGKSKSLLELLKDTVDVNELFSSPNLNEDKAKAIGKAMSTSLAPFAKHINEDDTGQYFTFNLGFSNIRALVQPAINEKIDQIRKIIGST